jgi:hypothetical protein
VYGLSVVDHLDRDGATAGTRAELGSSSKSVSVTVICSPPAGVADCGESSLPQPASTRAPKEDRRRRTA